MYRGDGEFRHWALFVENEEDETKSSIVHVEGAPGHFRYDARRSNAHASNKLEKISKLRTGAIHI